ncbi:hypothetical protein RZS08_60530, partial [Arthrospira platensis SPKY1]|nr:hypothetical protein [Arthrospira platensis SPKY1]
MFKSGGIETSIRNLALVLCSKGYKVEILTFGEEGLSQEWQEGIVVHRVAYEKSSWPVLLNRNLSRACLQFLQSRTEAYHEIWLRNLRPALYLDSASQFPNLKY